MSSESIVNWVNENRDTLKFLKDNLIISDNYIYSLSKNILRDTDDFTGKYDNSLGDYFAREKLNQGIMLFSNDLNDLVEKATEIYLEHEYFSNWQQSYYSIHNVKINKPFINAMLKKAIIDVQTIEKSLEKGVLNYARSQIELMEKVNADQTNPLYPFYVDHTLAPEFIVYAYLKGALSKEDEAKILFDKSVPIEKLIYIYNKPDLISELRDNLLN
jgi:hypothetical protein